MSSPSPSPSPSLIIRTIELAASRHRGRPLTLAPHAYTAKEWRDRGEEYGTKSLLVVTHDGGEFSSFFNWAYEDTKAVEAMTKALDSIGAYSEGCTCWYTAIYPAA